MLEFGVSLKVSVVVCTQNRAALLKILLESLLRQNFPKNDYEIRVVDNGSKDQTAAIVAEYSKKVMAPQIHYIYEEKIGSSWARNAGWQSAQGRYVVYIDDDERAEENWLSFLISALQQVEPTPAIVGGRIFLDWGGPKPTWLHPDLEKYYSFVDLGSEGKFLGEKDYILTSNLAIRREIFDLVGGFCTDLGHRGKFLLGGEDVEFIDRVRRRGKQIYYEPKAKVFHAVIPERQNLKWLILRSLYAGMSQPILDDIEYPGVKWIFFNARKSGAYLCEAVANLLIGRHAWSIKAATNAALYIGRIVGLAYHLHCRKKLNLPHGILL